ncbi:hypothetical protein ACFO25_04590 [Paenactinomyces guangxiensis]|uniref:Transglycosylase SLT domain-containing protein n=1 Tax=Paenactinomyces guangxiensis TaxID=1490290 RepID=A0A7W1WPH4_9BACL|nr:hypothetical protein [Paenactinomyces guangxiensis]MBA4493656.1 hypothetical protein [Paenactinomyces guangxiensis]MBH8590943.1 hypothetical protein [Paenactinomyces guangxiensis]
MEVLTKTSVLTKNKQTAIPFRANKPANKQSKHRNLILAVILAGMLISISFIFLFALLFFNVFSQDPSRNMEEGQWEVSAGFPLEAKKYLSIYQEAGEKYGVPWPVLAAVHKVETDFGRNLSVSSVGATGHTQVRP